MKVVSHYFPNKSGIPVSPFPDLLCNISLSVNSLRKICNNYYYFRLVSLCFSVP